jgi:RNA polymerase sigma-70 factor (ECF subfamily)
MPSARTDRELLEAARRGDAQAVEQLLERYEKNIFRFGLRMCGSESDAKDVLQETLLAAFKGLPEFRGEAEISTWLYQLARSFCTKSRRLRAGEPATTASLDQPAARAAASSEALPDARAHAREIGQALQAALLGLSERHREVVILKDVEGLSAEEIAQVLGEDLAAVKSRLHRARLELRASLGVLLGEGATRAPCPELAETLSAYVSEDIDQAACTQIEAHLATCPGCSGACEDLRSAVSLCKRIPGDVVPEAVRKAVRHALASQGAALG